MAKLTKDSITALQLDETVKADLLSLFDDITTRENEIKDLRTKVPTDSQKVVNDVDFTKYEAAVKELDTLKQELASKLEKTGDEGESILSAFSQFFA